MANIETLLRRGEIVETTDSIMLRAARRALEKKAPFICEKNMADAIIIEAFADCVKSKPTSKRVIRSSSRATSVRSGAVFSVLLRSNRRWPGCSAR